MSWRDIPGWMKFQETYDEAVRNAPQVGARFLEIGTAFGRSAAYMGEAIIASGKEIEFHCLDTWEWGDAMKFDPEREKEHQASLDKWGTPMRAFVRLMKEHAPAVLNAPWFMPHKASSEEAHGLMSGTFDFVFVDGDHSFDGTFLDISLWTPRVRPGGIIAGDDYSEEVFPGIVQAVRAHFGEDFEVRTFDGWSHWVHKVKGGAR